MAVEEENSACAFGQVFRKLEKCKGGGEKEDGHEILNPDFKAERWQW
jgi:hypothetical protein